MASDVAEKKAKNQTEYIDNEIEQDLEDTQKNKYLTFVLDNEEYGIEIYNIMEIIGIEAVTKVPHTPDYVKGIINLRGSIIPVLDVRARFRKPAIEYTDRSCIVVANHGDVVIGLIVDSVREVISIPLENIQAPPQAKTGYYNKYIRNIGKIGENVKLLLDLDKLLHDGE